MVPPGLSKQMKTKGTSYLTKKALCKEERWGGQGERRQRLGRASKNLRDGQGGRGEHSRQWDPVRAKASRRERSFVDGP